MSWLDDQRLVIEGRAGQAWLELQRCNLLELTSAIFLHSLKHNENRKCSFVEGLVYHPDLSCIYLTFSLSLAGFCRMYSATSMP